MFELAVAFSMEIDTTHPPMHFTCLDITEIIFGLIFFDGLGALALLSLTIK